MTLASLSLVMLIQLHLRLSSVILPKSPISQNISEDIAPARIEERLSLLREFISELKPKQRSVVLICGLEKKSYEEAALILKIPVGTVRSRLHEARVTLRNRFLTEASDL